MTYVFAFAGGGGTSTTGRAVPRAARYFVVGVGGVGGVGGVAFAAVLEVFLVGMAVAATTPAASAGRLFAYMGGADELDALRETDPEVSGVMVFGLEPFLQYERLRPSKEEMGGGNLVNFSSGEGFCGINHCASLTRAFHTCFRPAYECRMARTRSQRQYPSSSSAFSIEKA